jgi:hypothetical protein
LSFFQKLCENKEAFVKIEATQTRRRESPDLLCVREYMFRGFDFNDLL